MPVSPHRRCYDPPIMSTPSETSPTETLQSHIKDAMRAKESERLAILRMLLSAVKNEQIELGKPLDDKAFLAVVKRLIKQRKDSAGQYRDADRSELADKEEREIGYLEPYLPAQVDEATLRAAVEELVAAEGLSGPRGIGPVMQAMMKRFGASADGGTINRIARDVLGT